MVAVVAYLLFAPEPSREYRLVFQNSSQLVKGGVVRIGGTPVGTIKNIQLTKNDLAEVRVSVSDEFAPLHQGTTAGVRAQGQAGVASRYVDISPGSNLEPELPDDAVIPIDATASTVDLDQIFNAIDGKTRAGLRRWIDGFSQWYDGREAEGNASAKQLPKALAAFKDLGAQINAQNSDFQRLLTTSGQALGALGQHSQQLTGAVSGARGTVQAIGADTTALNGVLDDMPATLKNGSEALANLRPAIDDFQKLVNASDEPSRILASYFRNDLRPVLDDSVPVIKSFRTLLERPGAGNDLLDSLRDLPAVAKATDSAFPQGIKGLKTSTPMLSFIRPYAPDLMSWFRGFGAAAGTYDASGHYVSSLPVTDAYTLEEDGAGGKLVPKDPAQRGKDLSTGNLKRCPGAATAAPSDGSAPFVDKGRLANVDCDPSQTPGAK